MIGSANTQCQNCTSFDGKINQISLQQQQCFTMLFLSILFIIGLFKLLKVIIRIISPLSWLPLDLEQRYKNKSQKSWAIITGGSQGIGFAFAQQLAKRNFNLILMSRSQSKLIHAKQQLYKLNSKIQIIIKSVDFQKLRKSQHYEQLMKPYFQQNLDISVLVNNVGIYNSKSFLQNSYEQIKRQTVVNLIPITCLSRLLIQKMQERNKKYNKKSAIINLSSCSMLGLFAHSSNYCATKDFDDLLSRSLENQFSNIDFLSVRPYLVTSTMTKNQTSFLHVTTKQCAQGAIKDLGRYSISYGHWWHRIQGVIVEQFQGKIINSFLSWFNNNLSLKYKQIQQKNK